MKILSFHAFAFYYAACPRKKLVSFLEYLLFLNRSVVLQWRRFSIPGGKFSDQRKMILLSYNLIRVGFFPLSRMQMISRRTLEAVDSLPKLHKRPYKARFIANSSSCTTTELSKLLTSCLTAIKAKVIKYCETVYERSGKNMSWPIKILVKFLVN